MALLPPQFDAYSALITIVLLIVDGLIIGVAAKRGVMSFVLLVVGLLLAGFAGLAIPFSISSSDVITHMTNIFLSQIRHMGASVSAFPISWLIGFAIGIWKG